MGEMTLGGPLILQRPTAQPPSWAGDLDLLAPLTGNPMGLLAKQCDQWKRTREFRLTFILPFIMGKVPSQWKDRADAIIQYLGVDSLLAFIPDPAHWDAAFTVIPKEEFGSEPAPAFLPEEVWKESGATALWEIRENRVLWAEKFCSREKVRQVGRSLEDWVGKPE